MSRPTFAQDRQARGHFLANLRPEGSSSDFREPDLDSHQRRQRDEQNAMILSSWELLAKYALTTSESIPQTRLRFEKELAMDHNDKNFNTSDEWEDEFEVPFEEAIGAIRGPGGSSPADGKGKEGVEDTRKEKAKEVGRMGGGGRSGGGSGSAANGGKRLSARGSRR